MSEVEPWNDEEYNSANEEYTNDQNDFNNIESQYNACIDSGCSEKIQQEYKQAKQRVLESRTKLLKATAKSFGIERVSFLEGFDDEKMVKDWNDITWGDGTEIEQADGKEFTEKYEQLAQRLQDILDIKQADIEETIKKNNLSLENGKITGDLSGLDEDAEKLAEESDGKDKLSKETIIKWIKRLVYMSVVLGGAFGLYYLVHEGLCKAGEANSGCIWIDNKTGEKHSVVVAGGPNFCNDMSTCCGDCTKTFVDVYPRDKCADGNCCACSFDANWEQHGCATKGGKSSSGSYTFYCESPWDVINDIVSDLAKALNPENWSKWIKIIMYCALGILGVVVIFYIIRAIIRKRSENKEEET